jgi:hypothetical protein
MSIDKSNTEILDMGLESYEIQIKPISEQDLTREQKDRVRAYYRAGFLAGWKKAKEEELEERYRIEEEKKKTVGNYHDYED